MLLSNKITGVIDHQYLWKGTINGLDFLHRDVYQRKIASKSWLGLAWCAEPRPELFSLEAV